MTKRNIFEIFYIRCINGINNYLGYCLGWEQRRIFAQQELKVEAEKNGNQ